MSDKGEVFREAEQKFGPSPKITSPDGWIAPNGVFYACTPAEHDELAKHLLKNHEAIIKERLENKMVYGMAHDIENYNAREVLKETGYALLSDNTLTETNTPDRLTTKQIELAEKSKIVFSPKSGQLSPEAYRKFKTGIDGMEGVGQVFGFEMEHTSHENRRNVDAFLADPAGELNIEDEYSFPEKLFDFLSKDNVGELSAKSRKLTVRWRRLDLIPGESTFLELANHDHTLGGTYEDVYPGVEDSIKLVTGEAIGKFIQEQRLLVHGDIKLLH
ncbi:MAG: hypothetical protein HYV90_05485 [Candidatus Woesebacteria bacterium]|nr:MAG: hypothetical protein HYV90_05485 [Candidatus Woesebacteria bacterium]